MTEILTEIYVNQGMRRATFLAQLENGWQLYQYEMPEGLYALRIIKPEKTWVGGRNKNMSYARLPQYWVDTIVAAGNENKLSFLAQQQTPEQFQAARERFWKMVEKARRRKPTSEAREDDRG